MTETKESTPISPSELTYPDWFDGKHLKINTADFKERLEEILNTPALAVPEA